MKYNIGIDIGSTCAKVILLDENSRIFRRFLLPTGWSSVDTAEHIHSLLSDQGVNWKEAAVVATGYGRISVPYADKSITEITCHGRGACHIFGRDTLTVIDIGGQDTKLISVENGLVKDFIMNDKCSAGTGRFLEIMSNTLAVTPSQLCQLAAEGGGTSISSMCTVFAESEVISLIGKGESKENIAYAVIDSITRKVAIQAGKLNFDQTTVCLTGGLCDFPYLRQSLIRAVKVPVVSCPDGRYAGAVGAALTAAAIKK